MPDSFLLIVRHADGSTQRYTRSAGTFTLGREPDCDLVLQSSDVSRRHARVILGEDHFQIVDLGSTLGTKVNGQPLRGPTRGAYPAMLQLGSVNISVKLASGEADLQPRVESAAPPVANPHALVPYQFGHEIARGGMGSILEADDCKLGRRVAVKVMLSELDADAAQQTRFINEAAVLGRLEHPNIVPVHDIGCDSAGQLYYSMKLVKGRTLQSILDGLSEGDAATASHYTLDRLLTIFRKVCDAMAFAHANGIIHRDLKPENIMVGEFGEVLVMDWGLAKFLHEDRDLIKALARSGAAWEATLAAAGTNFGMTMDGDVMGTPQYMSPEQAEGRVADMDARSDIFSLGGILYCILTLRPPVEGKTLKEVLEKVVTGKITPPSVHGTTTSKGKARTKGAVLDAKKITPLPHMPGGKVPGALSAVVMKALTLPMTKRYQTIATLSADIEKYQSGFATSAENAGAWKQFTLLIKRNKAAAFGIAAVLIVGGTLGTQAVLAGRRAEHTLTDLRRTAPVFYAQAKVDFEEGNFEAAIEKIGYAIELDDTAADYHLFRANLREALQDLTAAAEGYRRVLALRPTDAAAQTNLALCEKLLHESNGAPLDRAQQTELLAALRTQKRLVESAPLAALINPDADVARAAILSRLREARKQPGWKDAYVSALADGSFKVSLYSLSPIDFSVLKGQPVSAMKLDDTDIEDLSTLAGLPLKELSLRRARTNDLSPLRGMPLENLDLGFTRASDLSPLRGMKLKRLVLEKSNAASDLTPLAGMPLTLVNCEGSRGISEISPLHGAPLVDLGLGHTAVSSLAPLAGAPLKRLNVGGTKVTDITPLSECPALEELAIFLLPITDLAPLAKLHLTYLNCEGTKITSIDSLRGQPLRFLAISKTAVTDLSPLEGCTTLEEITVPDNDADLSLLRKLPRLKLISTRALGNGIGGVHPVQTAEEFWKEYDAQQAAGKK